MSDQGYWRFCDLLERTRVTSPAVASAPETERVVLEQHTGTGEYRVRPLADVVDDADGS